MGKRSKYPVSVASALAKAEIDPLRFQAGDEITLEIFGQDEVHRGFYGGIRDDGGEVLFLFVGDDLKRCYWPAEDVHALRISPVSTETKKCRKNRAKAE